MKKQIPYCFYFIVYDKFKEKFPQRRADMKDARTLLRAWNIPKELRPIILKEMEILGLLKIISKYELEICTKESLLNNKSKVFALVGLWSQTD